MSAFMHSSEVDTMAKSSDAQIKASNKYRNENTKQIPLRVNLNTQSDVLSRFDNVESKQGYIVSLVRSDVFRRNNRAIKSGEIEVRSDNVAKNSDFIENHFDVIKSKVSRDIFDRVVGLFTDDAPKYIIVAELLRTIDHDIVLS